MLNFSQWFSRNDAEITLLKPRPSLGFSANYQVVGSISRRTFVLSSVSTLALSLGPRKSFGSLNGISAVFQDEIDKVDSEKRITYVIDTHNYSSVEWSYSGLEVSGGSELACEYGASELLEAMGFRWYVPDTGSLGNQSRFTKRPKTINTRLASSKQSYWMPSNTVFLVYGHSWAGTKQADRVTLTGAWNIFRTLHGLSTATYPVGHRWSNIILANLAYFQENPRLIMGGVENVANSKVARAARFDLSVTGDDYNNLVHICAAHLLRDGLTPDNRTHFDPTDGDTNPSDLVFSFAKAVVDKMRAGTTEINGIPEQVGVPHAQIGVYAYAGHRLPPKNSVRPGVYTQVALGFNRTTLSYQELVEQHAAKADAVLLREYWDTQVWSQGAPLINNRAKRDYFDQYDDFRAAGVLGFNAEFAANWLVNMVMFRCGVRKAKTGIYTYDEALDDIVADVFESDPAVRRLYQYWSDPFELYHLWGLRKSFDIVEEMRESWYKEYFQQLMVILYADIKLSKLVDGFTITDSTAAISLLSKVTAVRRHDIIHSYAWIRQRGNSALNLFPELKFNAKPEPKWLVDPVPPSLSDFVASHAAIVADTARDADLDSNDLVLVEGIVPTTDATSPASRFLTIGPATYYFIGPGELRMVERTSGEVEMARYGAGLHRVQVRGTYELEPVGGLLFLDTFPIVRKDPDQTNLSHWLYVPQRMAGRVSIKASSRVTIYDASGRIDILPENNENYTSPADIGPGQVRVDNINTRGELFNLSANRYMSMLSTVALMPRVIAEEDFAGGSIVQIHRN